MSAPEAMAELICRYGSLYGGQIVLLALLSAITVYRREMSCNRCYAEEDGEGAGNNRQLSHASAMRNSRAATSWNEGEAEELLDRAGLYCSGALLGPVFGRLLEIVYAEHSRLRLIWQTKSPEEILEEVESLYKSSVTSASMFTETERAKSRSSSDAAGCPFSRGLPTDVQVHILSYLAPKDVLNYSGASRSCNRSVNVGETALTLWRELWIRDYAWVVNSWEIGVRALQRSGAHHQIIDKDFYFRFGLCYLNYVLAGHNTMQSCLVGLHGHIYDLSLFLMSHPGSPETVMVQAGRDATSFFESVRHSRGARRLAKSLCCVVDMTRTRHGSSGLRPTAMAQCSPYSSLPETATAPDVDTITVPSSVGAPRAIWQSFESEKEIAQQIARRFNGLSPLGECNVYYDPFQSAWRAWYTDNNFDPVFVHNL